MLSKFRRLYQPHKDAEACRLQARRLHPFLVEAEIVVDKACKEIDEIIKRAEATGPIIRSAKYEYHRAYKKKVERAAATGRWEISPNDNRFTVAAPRLKILEYVSDALILGQKINVAKIARETGLTRPTVDAFMRQVQNRLWHAGARGDTRRQVLIKMHQDYKQKQKWLDQGWYPDELNIGKR